MPFRPTLRLEYSWHGKPPPTRMCDARGKRRSRDRAKGSSKPSTVSSSTTCLLYTSDAADDM
eukprot:11063953-Lingulodinium_polyedra.AAC.1